MLAEYIGWGTPLFASTRDAPFISIPGNAARSPPADLILITHAHHDHLSPPGRAPHRQAARSSSAPLVRGPTGRRRSRRGPRRSAPRPRHRERSVESYNTDKPNHPRSARNVALCSPWETAHLSRRDTDLIPEMDDIRCDVACCPYGHLHRTPPGRRGRGAPHPQVVIPMHWGDSSARSTTWTSLTEQPPQSVQIVRHDAGGLVILNIWSQLPHDSRMQRRRRYSVRAEYCAQSTARGGRALHRAPKSRCVLSPAIMLLDTIVRRHRLRSGLV
jgi:hypothetical protein